MTAGRSVIGLKTRLVLGSSCGNTDFIIPVGGTQRKGFAKKGRGSSSSAEGAVTPVLPDPWRRSPSTMSTRRWTAWTGKGSSISMRNRIWTAPWAVTFTPPWIRGWPASSPPCALKGPLQNRAAVFRTKIVNSSLAIPEVVLYNQLYRNIRWLERGADCATHE